MLTLRSHCSFHEDMDTQYATLRCVLKVDSRCSACKMHTREILGSLVGAYDITMDAEKGTTTIVGQVEPNYCMKAISRCEGHAEVVWANLSHPKMRGESYGQYGYGSSSSSSYYDRLGDSYGPRRSLAEGMWHEGPTTYSPPVYSYNSNNFGYDEARWGSQYQPPYMDDSASNLCNIM